ncbi:putative transcription factor B3-Domain family [Rosa chinensis]|uniref:Putative transcription factor B3-Domain family n=1 Tax=Rosa chinensis TaxID=74649 RepID=A0A2P6RRW5_ROSCH|nr:putative B3 domain-containing protein Os03g0621600 isoform X1 [Rosa chinensis]PRQ49170.1 putative transcription factor B3-Domain family [Rosa chinensis]
MARKRKPSFFKVLIGDFSDKLRIPQAFRKHLAASVLQQSHLRTPAGTWLVDVKSDNGRFFLQKGWKQFVHDNGLKLGEFLIFRYAGNSKFYVDIYGRHGCKKEFIMPARSSEKPFKKRHGNESHRTNAVMSSSIHPKKKMDYQKSKGSAGENKTSQETISVKSEPIDFELETCMDIDESIRNMNSRETLSFQPQVANSGLEAANRYSSNHPCFRTLLTETYVTKGILHIPCTFVKDYIKIKKRTAELQVSNRLWSVKWINDSRSSRFSQGWNEFVRQNDLKVGDVCVFELIKQTNDVVMMKVSFFRR